MCNYILSTVEWCDITEVVLLQLLRNIFITQVEYAENMRGYFVLLLLHSLLNFGEEYSRIYNTISWILCTTTVTFSTEFW
jgi:hypothetical protein